MTRNARRRLAIVLSHPTQYYSPWFRWLAVRSNLEFKVFYLWDFGVAERRDPQFRKSFQWDVDLLTGYDSEFVPNVSRDPGYHSFRGLDNPLLGGRLGDWNPSAILLFGYRSWSHLRAMRWAKRRGVPLLFRGDSHFLGRGNPGFLRTFLLRAIYRRFSAFLYVGSANRDYFAALGVPAEKLFFAPHSVNHELFDAASAAHRTAAAGLRAALGIAPSARVVLFAGKFTPSKQPMELLTAFLSLNRDGAVLVFVGDGGEKSAVEAAAAGSASRVRFLPFANQSEMPSRYAMADLFVLPSRGLYETWGLAVNEAMHMGVPCLVSDRVGCQRDLVSDGQTGWVFRAGDPAHLRERLGTALAALADPEPAGKIRRAVAERIVGYSYERTAAGLAAALDAL